MAFLPSCCIFAKPPNLHNSLSKLPLGKRKRHQLLVGFAAETDALEANAQKKLRRKKLDLIVANDARAMDAETNQVTLLYRDGRVERLPEMPKSQVATAIIRRVTALRT